jgi:hypothetical protein
MTLQGLIRKSNEVMSWSKFGPNYLCPFLNDLIIFVRVIHDCNEKMYLDYCLTTIYCRYINTKISMKIIIAIDI